MTSAVQSPLIMRLVSLWQFKAKTLKKWPALDEKFSLPT